MISEDLYGGLRRLSSLASLGDGKAIEGLGILIDGAWDRRDAAGTEHAIGLADALFASDRYRTLAPELQAQFHYCLANAWYGKDHLGLDAASRAWDWHAEPLEQQVFHLRSALTIGIAHPWLRCQVLTNLGNALSRVGRPVEAIELYDEAIALSPGYGMPLGNRGIALETYAQSVADIGHQIFLLQHAAASLARAARLPVDEPGIEKQFAERAKALRKAVKGYRLPKKSDYTIGRSKAERKYRSWVLQERLFLNPLNDLGELPIAAHDPISPISIVTRIGEGPYLFSFFNTLKQEFVSARFLLFQGLHRSSVHYSDRDVKLSETMDYAIHRLGSEEVKVAFRVAYSLLDKVAFFLNDYFRLGIPHSEVKFRELWYESRRKEKAAGMRPLRTQFANSPNLPLRGLFWISKDLAEPRDDRRAVLAPDAQDLVQIRNALEHKHLRLAHFGTAGGPFPDPLARVVTIEDFDEKALRILKHARAALIQLTCSVSVEERVRAKNATGLTPQIPLLDQYDRQKRR